MISSNLFNTRKPIAVIGSGSFGTAIAQLIAENYPVLFYTRNRETYNNMTATHTHNEIALHKNIIPSYDLANTIARTDLLYFTIPSKSYPELLKVASPYLNPSQIIIHGTKGLVVNNELSLTKKLDLMDVHTISDLIYRETPVLKVGCISGPNLAHELYEGHPAATVVASHFGQVIKACQVAIKTSRFQVFGSYDIRGVELAGVLKNVISIASGMVAGLGFGENTKALLISRGLIEMIRIASYLGAETNSFFGLAGIGDLIATCMSPYSRNYTVGYRLAKGESLDQILNTMNEVAEGVSTTKIAHIIAYQNKLHAPIIAAIYDVLYESLSIQDAISRLMAYPMTRDVDIALD